MLWRLALLSLLLAPACAVTDPERLARAEQLLAVGETRAAIGYLREELATLPIEAHAERVETLDLLVHAYAINHDPERALACIERALALEPVSAWRHYKHGVALHEIGRFDEASAAFCAALEIDPGHVRAWQWRGYMKKLQGRHLEALDDYATALEILERASEDAFVSWGSDRRSLLEETFRLRAIAYDALGSGVEASLERARADALARP